MSYNLSNGYIDSDEASNLSFNQSDCINNTYFISSSNYHSSLGFENQNNIDISNLFIFPKNNNNDPSLITYNNNIYINKIIIPIYYITSFFHFITINV